MVLGAINDYGVEKRVGVVAWFSVFLTEQIGLFVTYFKQNYRILYMEKVLRYQMKLVWVYNSEINV